jgi:hypothetical protein
VSGFLNPQWRCDGWFDQCTLCNRSTGSCKCWVLRFCVRACLSAIGLGWMTITEHRRDEHSLGFCLHSLLQCLSAVLFLWHLSFYVFEKSSSFICWVFHYQSLVPFHQVLVSLFSSCLFVFVFLLFKKFFFCFCLFLLGSFTVPAMTVATAYIKLFISVMSDSFSSNVLQFCLFHPSASSICCFPSVLVTFTFWESVVGSLYATLFEGLSLPFP